jgi:hypothetical protein
MCSEKIEQAGQVVRAFMREIALHLLYSGLCPYLERDVPA